MKPRVSPRQFLVWFCVTLGLAVVAAGNWHLVHVAISSQPECVAHMKIGERDGESSRYSAARSSCTSPQ